MKKYFRAFIPWLGLAVLIILLAFHPVRAEEAHTKSTTDCAAAQALLEKFLNLDQDVGRLSSEAYQKTFAGMFPQDFDEPGWDMSTVIQSYQIVSCKMDPKGFELGVKYQVLGELSVSARNGECPLFEAKNKVENAKAHVRLEKGKLLIDETPGNPHIGIERAKKFIRGFESTCQKEDAAAFQGLQKSLSAQ